MAELQQMLEEKDALMLWSKRHASYSLLAKLAEDLVAAPTSQANVERIFSVCRWFTDGHRNYLKKYEIERTCVHVERCMLIY